MRRATPTHTTARPAPIETETRSLLVARATKVYGQTLALDAVTLEVEPGELVVLLGPSGCGKTTLLRVVAGLEPLTRGAVHIAGRQVNRGPLVLVPPDKRPVGMVFQELALWPHLTAEQNVSFPLTTRKVAPAERRRRARELMQILDLRGTGARRPSELSGGEQQRVALARALISEPKLMLMDEPLASLDTHLRRRLRQKIRRIHDGFGMTTLYVTHDREEALGVADRIVLMRQGRVIAQGPPGMLYTRPATVFSAQLLSDANLLPADYLQNGYWRTPIGTLRAPAPPDNERYMLFIRPETLARGGEDELRGEVDAVSYRGCFWEAEVNVRGEEILWRSPDPVEVREQVHLRLTEEPHPVLDDR
jgi:ABC-type Fe3+/spermidine/putrescine transport system ATPase subunit